MIRCRLRASSSLTARLALGSILGVCGASSLFDWQSKTITGFPGYQTASAQDAHGKFADPLYLNVTTTPYIFDLASGSPALNAGTNLGVNTVGVLDYAGNPRVNGTGQINMGAYEQ